MGGKTQYVSSWATWQEASTSQLICCCSHYPDNACTAFWWRQVFGIQSMSWHSCCSGEFSNWALISDCDKITLWFITHSLQWGSCWVGYSRCLPSIFFPSLFFLQELQLTWLVWRCLKSLTSLQRPPWWNPFLIAIIDNNYSLLRHCSSTEASLNCIQAQGNNDAIQALPYYPCSQWPKKVTKATWNCTDIYKLIKWS